MPSGKNVCGYAESQSCLEEQIKEVISNNVMREVSTSGEVPPEGLIRERNMSGQEGGQLPQGDAEKKEFRSIQF